MKRNTSNRSNFCMLSRRAACGFVSVSWAFLLLHEKLYENIFLHSPPPPTPTRHFCFTLARHSHTSPTKTSETMHYTNCFTYVLVSYLGDIFLLIAIVVPCDAACPLNCDNCVVDANTDTVARCTQCKSNHRLIDATINSADVAGNCYGTVLPVYTENFRQVRADFFEA